MAEPPRDANGNVIPYDDPEEIKDGDPLIRHINPEHHVIYDKNLGCSRLSSGAFTESSEPPGGMSVDLERPMIEDGVEPLANLPEDFGAVRLIAGDMRQLGHKVGKDPLPDNPYHGEVWNIGRGKARKRILEKAAWIRKPEAIQ